MSFNPFGKAPHYPLTASSIAPTEASTSKRALVCTSGRSSTAPTRLARRPGVIGATRRAKTPGTVPPDPSEAGDQQDEDGLAEAAADKAGRCRLPSVTGVAAGQPGFNQERPII